MKLNSLTSPHLTLSKRHDVTLTLHV